MVQTPVLVSLSGSSGRWQSHWCLLFPLVPREGGSVRCHAPLALGDVSVVPSTCWLAPAEGTRIPPELLLYRSCLPVCSLSLTFQLCPFPWEHCIFSSRLIFALFLRNLAVPI